MKLDKTDVVGWYKLDRDQLIIAAAIYLTGLDAGDGQRTVLAAVMNNTEVAQKAKRRLEADAELRRNAEARVDGVHQSGRVTGAAPSAPPPPARSAMRDDGSSRLQQHYDLLCAAFTSEELRSFVRFNFEPLANSLSGGSASLNVLAHDVACGAEARGYADSSDCWGQLVGRIEVARLRALAYQADLARAAVYRDLLLELAEVGGDAEQIICRRAPELAQMAVQRRALGIRRGA